MAISSPEMMLVPSDAQHLNKLGLDAGLLTQVDITEATTTDLAADTILVAHAEILPTYKALAKLCRKLEDMLSMSQAVPQVMGSASD